MGFPASFAVYGREPRLTDPKGFAANLTEDIHADLATTVSMAQPEGLCAKDPPFAPLLNRADDRVQVAAPGPV